MSCCITFRAFSASSGFTAFVNQDYLLLLPVSLDQIEGYWLIQITLLASVPQINETCEGDLSSSVLECLQEQQNIHPCVFVIFPGYCSVISTRLC